MTWHRSRIIRHLAALAFVSVAGCSQPPPFTRAQAASVRNAVGTCTAASGRLTPQLRRSDPVGARNAAIDARNMCSVARADIVSAVGTGTRLDACYFAVDRQEAVQRAELANLDDATPANGKAVLSALDEAIRQQGACAQALEAIDRGD